MEKNYAILIDSDNVSHKYVSSIFEEISSFGNVPIRRIYGDFTKDSKWRDICLEHSIKQIHQYNYTSGKNATDSTMIIDAMDLLYNENYLSGFVLVSSDSDFTGLCQRLRESNKEIIGMGEKKTPQSLVKACTTFKYLESLYVGDDAINKISTDDIVINKIIEMIYAKGHMLVSQIKEQITKIYNDFDEKNYGYNQMKNFLQAIPGVKISMQKDGKTLIASLDDKTSRVEIDNVKNILFDIIDEKNGKIHISQLQQNLSERGIGYKNLGYSKFKTLLQDLNVFKISKNIVSKR